MRISLAFGVCAAVLLAGAAFSQELNVGAISEPYAWLDKQGPEAGPRLHVIGLVTVRNACFEAVASYAGETKSIPSTLLIRVDIVAKDGVMCTQVEGQERNVEFRYDDPSYAGSADTVQISTETDKKEVKIEIVQ